MFYNQKVTGSTGVTKGIDRTRNMTGKGLIPQVGRKVIF